MTLGSRCVARFVRRTACPRNGLSAERFSAQQQRPELGPPAPDARAGLAPLAAGAVLPTVRATDAVVDAPLLSAKPDRTRTPLAGRKGGESLPRTRVL